jgi:serine/threonine protein kinase
MMEQLGERDERRSADAPDESRPARSMSERLGDFRILREIGRGGMGVVYEAVQESLGRHVALKVFSHHPQIGSIQLIRFQREARAAALLHHTNIVPVFGVGVHEHVHYYAMQYIHGQSLDSVIREMIRLRRDEVQELAIPQDATRHISLSLADGLLTNRFGTPPDGLKPNARVSSSTAQVRGQSDRARPAEDADGSPPAGSHSTSSLLAHTESQFFRSVARLGVQVAGALAYAHAHGVVHRDIKPGNLLLDLQGTVWVTDFGLAKAQGHEELTSPGDVVGTLRYMAPERFQGKGDAQCDIYSLGVTLYELLTLRPAFTASHRVQLMSAILHDRPAAPRKLDPRIHPRPGNDRAEGHRQGSGRPVRDRRRAGPGAGAIRRRPADPVSPGLGPRTALALVPAEPGGRLAHPPGGDADERAGGRFDRRGLEVPRAAR